MSDCSFHCLYIYIIAIVHDDVLTWFWLRSMLTYPNTGREERKNDNANHLGPFALSLMSQNLCQDEPICAYDKTIIYPSSMFRTIML